MGILDGLLGQLGGDNADLANLAEKVGLSPEHAAMAVAALAKFHPMDVDTAEGAAAETGIPTDKLQEIIGHIGGEEVKAASAISLRASSTRNDVQALRVRPM